MTMPLPLPSPFADLEQLADRWARPTIAARHALRLSTSPAERAELYNALLPQLPQILEFLGGSELEKLDQPEERLLQLALSAVQVALAIENNGNGPREAMHAKSAVKMKTIKELDRF
jgi:hypothetical protein